MAPWLHFAVSDTAKLYRHIVSWTLASSFRHIIPCPKLFFGVAYS